MAKDKGKDEDRPSKILDAISLVTVEPIAFAFTFGQFLSFPITSALLYKKSCLLDFNETFCDTMSSNKTFQREHTDQQDTIQASASFWTMLNQFTLAAPNILIVFLFMASWGDKVDRKVPILLPCLGALACNVVNFLCAYFMHWHVSILLVGTALNGVLGTYSTLLMGVYSYIVHVSTPQQKTVRVGIVESMSYMAGGVSVFVSGLLRNQLGFTGVYVLILGFVGFSFMYAVICLKSVNPTDGKNVDGKDQERNTEEGCSTLWGFGAIKNMMKFLSKKREGNTSQYIWLYIILINLMQLGTSGEIDLLFIFLKRAPRSFNSVEYGYFKGSENFCRGISLIILLPILKKVFSWRDTSIIFIGVLFKGIQFSILAISQSVTLVFVALIFATLQGFPAAALRSGMSRLVDEGENGRLFGVVAVTESLVSLIASFMFNGLYPLTLDAFDGILFECVAGISVVALFITVYLHVEKADLVTNEDVVVRNGDDQKTSNGDNQKTSNGDNQKTSNGDDQKTSNGDDQKTSNGDNDKKTSNGDNDKTSNQPAVESSKL